MDAITSTHDAGEPSRYVYAQRTRCPACASADLLTYKSMREDDESMRRYTRCRSCDHKFVVVLE